jgi:phenylpyruvate tautomerase PptA (4-oxalocrotonate tautomerase family)
MPMLDVYVPAGALEPDSEAELVNRITDILIRAEGFDPTDPATRAVSWVFLPRPVAVYVGGQLSDAPHYKVVPSVPEGQFNPEARANVIREVTEAILDAENGAWPRDPGRVWVFPTEIPEGHWGGFGRVAPLWAILRRITGISTEQAQTLAAQRIADSRTEHHRRA